MFEILWQYSLIFIMAATPWLEILVVIPIGVGMGLNPFFVGVFSFIGNFLPILLIVYSLHKLQKTGIYKNWSSNREKKTLKNKEKQSSKNNRAMNVFRKYGLPGLAILGPLLTGIHLAAIIALSLKIDKNKITVWMGGSLLVWTLFITIASVYSIDWVRNIF
ncbi:small multidrug efflux protein - like protein [Salipaludibacillus neizhouensis]|uniref:Small multidrug efflux protein-like protein n=1 Tax=Salipaludibacillus neizhouensis TaxID=885475 RepID=A0A3A9K6P3_9BACI|nr:small multi-drug export protein [Salipaludibacillus neizhouensis]RKL66172.1 small multidrug efflux protein - like protein [Salipaludibacillus neizhouensis]